MTAVFAIRHTQTTWNVEQRYQGRLEAPLSAEGKEQAKLVARAFEGCDVTAVYSSPLERAVDLAREVAHASDSPMECDPRLSEVALGPWEGLYRHEIQQRFPQLYRDWYTRPDTVQFPGGERVHDVQRRSQDVLSEIFARYPDGNVVVVTHSVVIETMVATSLGLDLRDIHRIRVSNGGITTLCGTEPPGSLLSLNVTDALYHSPVAAATQQNCISWKEREFTA